AANKLLARHIKLHHRDEDDGKREHDQCQRAHQKPFYHVRSPYPPRLRAPASASSSVPGSSGRGGLNARTSLSISTVSRISFSGSTSGAGAGASSLALSVATGRRSDTVSGAAHFSASNSPVTGLMGDQRWAR